MMNPYIATAIIGLFGLVLADDIVVDFRFDFFWLEEFKFLMGRFLFDDFHA